MSLPTLILNERVLSPRFGYVFQPRLLQPYESIAGILWMFARMIALPGHAVATHLCRQTIDPYEGIDPLDIDVPLVAQLLGSRANTCAQPLVRSARTRAPIHQTAVYGAGF